MLGGAKFAALMHIKRRRETWRFWPELAAGKTLLTAAKRWRSRDRRCDCAGAAFVRRLRLPRAAYRVEV